MVVRRFGKWSTHYWRVHTVSKIVKKPLIFKEIEIFKNIALFATGQFVLEK